MELEGEHAALLYLQSQLGADSSPNVRNSQGSKVTLNLSFADESVSAEELVECRDQIIGTLNGLLKLLRLTKKPISHTRTYAADANGKYCGEIVLTPKKVGVAIDDGETLTM